MSKICGIAMKRSSLQEINLFTAKKIYETDRMSVSYLN
jgi:hypothetical protein